MSFTSISISPETKKRLKQIMFELGFKKYDELINHLIDLSKSKIEAKGRIPKIREIGSEYCPKCNTLINPLILLTSENLIKAYFGVCEKCKGKYVVVLKKGYSLEWIEKIKKNFPDVKVMDWDEFKEKEYWT